MVLVDELRYRFVEGEEFRNFCSVLEPQLELPSNTTARRDCLHLYQEEKHKLKDVLVDSSERVCLTMDTLTSSRNLHYICLAAHYIDSIWKLQKRILNFCQVPNHKGETIGRTVEMSLSEWDIGNVFTMTVDNACSNDSVVAFLSEKVAPILKCELMKITYCPYILNVIGVECFKYNDHPVSRIRDVIRYVRAFPVRLKKFKACVKQEKISSEEFTSIDVPAEWSSTYLMLETAENLDQYLP